MSKGIFVKIDGELRQIKNVWIKESGIVKQKSMPKGLIGGSIREFMTYVIPDFVKFINEIPLQMAYSQEFIYIAGQNNIYRYDLYGNLINSISRSGFIISIDETGSIYVNYGQYEFRVYDKNLGYIKKITLSNYDRLRQNTPYYDVDNQSRIYYISPLQGRITVIDKDGNYLYGRNDSDFTEDYYAAFFKCFGDSLYVSKSGSYYITKYKIGSGSFYIDYNVKHPNLNYLPININVYSGKLYIGYSGTGRELCVFNSDNGNLIYKKATNLSKDYKIAVDDYNIYLSTLDYVYKYDLLGNLISSKKKEALSGYAIVENINRPYAIENSLYTLSRVRNLSTVKNYGNIEKISL